MVGDHCLLQFKVYLILSFSGYILTGLLLPTMMFRFLYFMHNQRS